jgi:hypothetical protein
VICNERYGGTGLTLENVRQLQATLCRQLHWRPDDVNTLTLNDAADVLEGIQHVSLEILTALQPSLAQDPFQTIDGLLLPDMTNIPILWASCFIVTDNEPSVCPQAKPPLPAAYLPLVTKAFERFGPDFLPKGHTVHWIGHNTWLTSSCRCYATRQRIAVEPQPRDSPKNARLALNLKPADRDILETVRLKALSGEAIATQIGRSYDYTRHRLTQLV